MALWYWPGWCISLLNEEQKNPKPPQNHRVAVEFKLQNRRHIWSLFSTRAEIAELLVAANGDVNAKAENAWTPLMLCCETANEVGLRILLKLKADPNALTYVTWRHLLKRICYTLVDLIFPDVFEMHLLLGRTQVTCLFLAVNRILQLTIILNFTEQIGWNIHTTEVLHGLLKKWRFFSVRTFRNWGREVIFQGRTTNTSRG